MIIPIRGEDIYGGVAYRRELVVIYSSASHWNPKSSDGYTVVILLDCLKGPMTSRCRRQKPGQLRLLAQLMCNADNFSPARGGEKSAVRCVSNDWNLFRRGRSRGQFARDVDRMWCRRLCVCFSASSAWPFQAHSFVCSHDARRKAA